MAFVKYKQKRRIHLDNVTFQFLRCIKGESDKAVAKKAKIHFTTIYKLRNNTTRYPSIKTFLKVFNAYGYELKFTPREKTNSISIYENNNINVE